MVEALILMVLGIGGWAVYLWHTKGKEEAKTFVEKSADEIQKTNVGILKGLVGCAWNMLLGRGRALGPRRYSRFLLKNKNCA